MARSLPSERKALAERYTIDAEEAERRERQAAEQVARQAEADEVARVEAEEAARAAAAAAAPEAERQTHSEPIEPPTQERPHPQLVVATVDDPPAPTEIAQGDEREQTLDLPIYRWFGND